jgi:hypothetical protein
MRLTSIGAFGAQSLVLPALLLLLGATPNASWAAGDEILDTPPARREIQRAAPPNGDNPAPQTTFDDTDTVAALDGILIALTEVADGGTYVWHRRDGRLSGMAQPTASFRDQSGQPCRHLVVVLNAFTKSKKVEGIACRLADKRWQLTG